MDETESSFETVSKIVSKAAKGSLAVSSSDVVLLDEPGAFYSTIRQSIRDSKRQICLSALYLGTGSLEKQLLEDLDEALGREKELVVTLVFDYNRAHRQWKDKLPQFHIILPLLQKYGTDRVRLRLYNMPKLYASYYQVLPVQLREILSVYHVKFLQFDETVMLTGANLSEEYFTSRLDRYMVIKRGLGSFVRKYAEIIVSQCHAVSADGTLKTPTVHESQLQSDLTELMSGNATCYDSTGDIDTVLFPLVQHASIGLTVESKALPDILNGLSALYDEGNSTDHASSSSSSSSRPVCTSFAMASPYPSFTAGLVEAMRSLSVALLSNGRDHGVLISASRLSHGFGGETDGLKAVIPTLHDSILHDRVQTVCGKDTGGERDTSAPKASTSTSTLNQGSRQSVGSEGEGVEEGEGPLVMLKYQRPGSTFHVKGIWCAVSQQRSTGRGTHSATGRGPGKVERAEDAASLTYVGSSNMGERSWKRDMELGFVLVTRSSQLRGALRSEVVSTLGHCQPVRVDELKELHEGPMKRLKSGSARLLSSKNSVALLTRLLRSYL